MEQDKRYGLSLVKPYDDTIGPDAGYGRVLNPIGFAQRAAAVFQRNRENAAAEISGENTQDLGARGVLQAFDPKRVFAIARQGELGIGGDEAAHFISGHGRRGGDDREPGDAQHNPPVDPFRPGFFGHLTSYPPGHPAGARAASRRPARRSLPRASTPRRRPPQPPGARRCTLDRGIDALLAAVEDGDVALTLGAGNVWQAGEKLLARLRDGQAGKK